MFDWDEFNEFEYIPGEDDLLEADDDLAREQMLDDEYDIEYEQWLAEELAFNREMDLELGDYGMDEYGDIYPVDEMDWMGL